MRDGLKCRLIILSMTLGLAIGCNGGGPSSSQISIAGNWQFTFTSIHGAEGAGAGAITQSGSSFSGTLTLTNACASSGPISGTISGIALSAVLTENGQAVNLTGTVASSGMSGSGTYTSAAGGCTNGDSGAWSGNDPSISGSFLGALRPADRLPVGVSLRLKEVGGMVSGSALFTSSACFSSVTLAGKAVGSTINLEGNAADGPIALIGTLDASGKTLSLESQVSGHCQAESAPGR